MFSWARQAVVYLLRYCDLLGRMVWKRDLLNTSQTLLFELKFCVGTTWRIVFLFFTVFFSTICVLVKTRWSPCDVAALWEEMGFALGRRWDSYVNFCRCFLVMTTVANAGVRPSLLGCWDSFGNGFTRPKNGWRSFSSLLLIAEILFCSPDLPSTKACWLPLTGMWLSTGYPWSYARGHGNIKSVFFWSALATTTSFHVP